MSSLRCACLRVDTAHDGLNGLAIVCASNFEMLLRDVLMPKTFQDEAREEVAPAGAGDAKLGDALFSYRTDNPAPCY